MNAREPEGVGEAATLEELNKATQKRSRRGQRGWNRGLYKTQLEISEHRCGGKRSRRLLVVHSTAATQAAGAVAADTTESHRVVRHT